LHLTITKTFGAKTTEIPDARSTAAVFKVQ